jgi:hypothetical protein
MAFFGPISITSEFCLVCRNCGKFVRNCQEKISAGAALPALCWGTEPWGSLGDAHGGGAEGGRGDVVAFLPARANAAPTPSTAWQRLSIHNGGAMV